MKHRNVYLALAIIMAAAFAHAELKDYGRDNAKGGGVSPDQKTEAEAKCDCPPASNVARDAIPNEQEFAAAALSSGSSAVAPDSADAINE